MLFDLRGRGRRTTVRIVYIGLAVLIGVGLVGFGVGGGFGSGGILSAASNNEGGGSSHFSAKIKQYEKLTRQNPSDAPAWEGLTKALLNEASNFTQTGVITGKAKAIFRRASQAWASYLALNPPNPSTQLATLMATIVYPEEGLNEPTKEVQALQIVLASRPESESLWSDLARYAYKAHNTRIGDLASEKTVALAPAADRSRLKTELAEYKSNPSGAGRSYTVTTNGKTYVFSKSPNGTLTGKEVAKGAGGTASTGATTTKK
jgi:hypothetical protein